MTLEIPKSQAGDLPDKDRELVPRNLYHGPSHHPGHVLLEADHQSLHPFTRLGHKVNTINIPKVVEEVINDDMLLPAGGEVVGLNQDLVGDGVDREVTEALEDVDGAAIDDHHLVDNLLGNGDLAESDNTRALATNISDVVHLAERRGEGGDVILRVPYPDLCH